MTENGNAYDYYLTRCVNLFTTMIACELIYVVCDI